MKSIVEQIHEEFYTSQSQLLLSKPNAAAQCLYQLGFFKSKSTDDAYIHNDMTRAWAEYFQMNYPNYRFITEKQVEIICNKYGLLCTTVDRYTGEVPPSKVAAMTSFRIKKGDIRYRFINEWGTVDRRSVYGGDVMFYDRGGVQVKKKEFDANELVGVDGLWICAPEADIDTEGLTKSGHNIGIQVKDPVVLQPVDEGFLIVAAWGEEASDENVVNHNMN